eukprot:10448389-Heterocapsa_arctica.AAC.1
MNNSAAYLDPIYATCSTGNALYWFMVSGGLAIAAEITVDKDTQLYSHYPVKLKIGGKLSEDMGVIIRRPSAFQGITKKEATFLKEISKPKKAPSKKTGSYGTKRLKRTSATEKISEEKNSKEEDRR